MFVNPDVTDGLRRAGAQVVMSHELVHVATDAVRRPVEPWLLEGFADYVALRDTRLPDRVTLGRAIEAARRDGVPDALPTAADFDTRARDLQARYEEAWLACRIIAERLGEQRLVSVYDAAAGDGGPRSAATCAAPVSTVGPPGATGWRVAAGELGWRSRERARRRPVTGRRQLQSRGALRLDPARAGDQWLSGRASRGRRDVRRARGSE